MYVRKLEDINYKYLNAAYIHIRIYVLLMTAGVSSFTCFVDLSANAHSDHTIVAEIRHLGTLLV
jgi:hypothetical protein